MQKAKGLKIKNRICGALPILRKRIGKIIILQFACALFA